MISLKSFVQNLSHVVCLAVHESSEIKMRKSTATCIQSLSPYLLRRSVTQSSRHWSLSQSCRPQIRTFVSARDLGRFAQNNPLLAVGSVGAAVLIGPLLLKGFIIGSGLVLALKLRIE